MSVKKKLLAAAFWLLVWQAAALLVGQKMLLASPIETLVRLSSLVLEGAFWRSLGFTLTRVMYGLFLGSLAGILLAACETRFPSLEALFAPLMKAVRAVPVASFIILALIWLPSRRLSVLIAFLITLPVVHAGTLSGIRNVDEKLIEMAQVFRMPPLRRLRALYVPCVWQTLRANMTVAVGLAFKSGIAAEVIGIPAGSVGEKLYKAKIYLATPDLFAWTLTIVLLSTICEKALLFLLDKAAEGCCR